MMEININKINQFSNIDDTEGKGVYLSLINVVSIINSIKFTNRVEAQNLYDINEPKKYFTDSFDYYQRLLNDKRTRDLVEFILLQIKNSIQNNLFIIPFPTSFILSAYKTDIDSLDEYKAKSELYIDEIKKDDGIDLFEQNLGVYLDDNKFIFPELELILVVDGQHRLAALKAVYFALKKLNHKDVNLKSKDPLRELISFTERKILEHNFDIIKVIEMLNNFQIVSTILLDFDVWEQGKVFANVNFNQKAVNKSLYYDIFGSFPDPDKNDIYLAHRWCFQLNKREDSVLQGKIKMLGTGNGFISQAFLCDSLVSFLRKGGIWYDVATNFSLDKKDSTDKIENFLVSYFKAISIKFGYDEDEEDKVYFWPKDGEVLSSFDSILYKTTGLGAIIKLIPFFYSKVENLINDNVEELAKKILEILNESLNKESLKLKYPYENEQILEDKVTGKFYFKRVEGNFSSGAGLGLQMRLYKQLLDDLGFKKNNEIEQYSIF